MMSLLKTLQWVALVCIFTSFAAPTSAHVLNETTAQVILRDGQIEVKISTAPDHLLDALQDDQAWLLGDIDTIMPADLNLKQQGEFIENTLQEKTRLTVNKQVIQFERVTFSRPADTEHSEIVFQAKHLFPEVKSIAISFHKALGPVHMSVVKPQYKRLRAGESAQIVF